MVCPWPCVASLDAPIPKQNALKESGKVFAQALSGVSSDSTPDDNYLAKLPPKIVMGNSVRVKISKAAYESGLAACKCNLHGRLTLHKGDSPLTTQALKAKLSNIWPQLSNWNLIPLGKGFFEFNFSSIEDMKFVWAMGVVNLKPGFLRLHCWSKDYTPKAQAQTHAQVWVRFLQLPQEYWGKQTLLEIASGLGTPITIDDATLNKRFGLFARILIDVDMAKKLFESIIVEREGYALTILVQYEKYPPFCTHCKTIGHNVNSCSKMNVELSVPKNATSAHHKVHTNYKLPTKKSILHAQNVAETIGKDNHQTAVDANAIATDKLHHVAVGNKSVTDNHEDMFDSAEDFEEGEILVHDIPEPQISIVKHPDFALQEKTGGSITLKNSFELLNENADRKSVV